MTTVRKSAPSETARIQLESLKNAVKKTLDRKKRLGHYVVIWKDDQAVLVGEDAPHSDNP